MIGPDWNLSGAVVLVVALTTVATWSAVEIWHHGGVFAKQRKKFLALAGSESPFRLFGELLTCPFCLSVWVAMIMTGLSMEWLTGGSVLWLLPSLWLSTCRLANLANDYTTNRNRTPKESVIFTREDDPEDEDDDGDDPDAGWDDHRGTLIINPPDGG